MKTIDKIANSKSEEFVFNFLLPLDAQSGILRFGKRFILLKHKDQEVNTRVNKIISELNNFKEPIIDNYHLNMFRTISPHITLPEIPTSPDWMRPIIAAAYLKAKILVQTGKCVDPIKNLNQILDKIYDLLRATDSSFFCELIGQTLNAARSDENFNNSLQLAGSEFNSLVKKLYIFENDIDIFSQEKECKKWLCKVTTTDEFGNQQTGIVSCWTVVLAVAILIVAAALI